MLEIYTAIFNTYRSYPYPGGNTECRIRNAF